MTDKATITVYLELFELLPNQMQYKQNSIELVPPQELLVAVDMPLDYKHVHNSEAVIAAQLGTENVPAPVLTPLGLYYLYNELSQHFQDEKLSEEGFEEIVEGKEDWEDETKPDEEEDWGDDDTTDSTTSEELPWEEEGEAKTDESWDDKEEDWE